MSDEEEVFDDEILGEEESEQGPAAIKALREKLKKAVAEKQEYLEGWQRARADFANYKREEVGLYADREERVKSDLVETLLPALDTFEMALKHLSAQAGAPGRKELELVHSQFIQALQKLGVEQFGKAGEEFNPHTHEALAQQGGGNTIVSVERSGYSVGNKVIRPAQVII